VELPGGSKLDMKILVCNSGSSSLKFGLFEANHEVLLAEGGIDWTTKPTRLVVRRPGRPDIREELELRQHSEDPGRLYFMRSSAIRKHLFALSAISTMSAPSRSLRF